jgi:uncharacterized protein (TIGR03437 family)
MAKLDVWKRAWAVLLLLVATALASPAQTYTTLVSFDGSAAAFTVVSATEIQATVPDGATTGFVSVTIPSGTLRSNKQFQVGP